MENSVIFNKEHNSDKVIEETKEVIISQGVEDATEKCIELENDGKNTKILDNEKEGKNKTFIDSLMNDKDNFINAMISQKNNMLTFKSIIPEFKYAFDPDNERLFACNDESKITENCNFLYFNYGCLVKNENGNPENEQTNNEDKNGIKINQQNDLDFLQTLPTDNISNIDNINPQETKEKQNNLNSNTSKKRKNLQNKIVEEIGNQHFEVNKMTITYKDNKLNNPSTPFMSLKISPQNVYDENNNKNQPKKKKINKKNDKTPTPQKFENKMKITELTEGTYSTINFEKVSVDKILGSTSASELLEVNSLNSLKNSNMSGSEILASKDEASKSEITYDSGYVSRNTSILNGMINFRYLIHQFKGIESLVKEDGLNEDSLDKSNKSKVDKTFMFLLIPGQIAESDGILEYDQNRRETKDIKYIRFIENSSKKNQEPDDRIIPLKEILEKYTWEFFRKDIITKLYSSFEHYIDDICAFNKNKYVFFECKNSSSIFKMLYQVDRCLAHHPSLVQDKNQVMILLAINFKDDLSKGSDGNYSKSLEGYLSEFKENLIKLINSGFKNIVMLNIKEEVFFSLRIKKEAYSEKGIRSIFTIDQIRKKEKEASIQRENELIEASIQRENELKEASIQREKELMKIIEELNTKIRGQSKDNNKSD